MNCDVCKSNEASVFLTQIVDGKMQKVNLCESCSKAGDLEEPTASALADFLLCRGELTQSSGTHP
jgi:protein arginine kinase activator